MMMKIDPHTFYFGKSDPSYGQAAPVGWEPGWDFRIVIKEDVGEINIEDTCGRYIPMQWTTIFKLNHALNQVGTSLSKAVLGDMADPDNV